MGIMEVMYSGIGKLKMTRGPTDNLQLPENAISSNGAQFSTLIKKAGDNSWFNN